MQISLLTIGSRGDVQPYLALAKGLQQAGHDVRLVTHELFRQFVTEHGVDFAPLAGDPEALLKSDVGQRMMCADSKLKAAREYIKALDPIAIPCAQDALDGCRDAEVLLCASSAYVYGEALGEYLNVPLIHLSIYPLAPSRLQSGPLATPWPSWATKLDLLRGLWLHQKVILDLQALVFRTQTNRFRQEVFGLPPRPRTFGLKTFSKQGHTWLYAYSSQISPRPADWSPRQHVTGWWFQDDAPHWQPPTSLVEFLDNGPPPIYIGFGSMFTPDRERLAGCVIDALRQSGQRGVLAKGWGLLDPKNVPDNCYLLDTAPHDWLFPKMAAIIHHGGAGTTGAGARAGVPNLAVPFAFDQPFWGRALHTAGMAPPPIAAKQLTADKLSTAMRTMIDDANMRRRAAVLGANIRAEDGVQNAVDIIERTLSAISGTNRRPQPVPIPG